MPVPTPKSNEERDAFISRCVETLSHLDSNRPRDQIIAICYSKWRAKGKIGVRGGDRGGLRNRPLRGK